MKLLFAASEAYPVIKTGGLGDVIYSLANQLQRQDIEVTVVLPAYRSVLSQMVNTRIVGQLQLPGAGRGYPLHILLDETRSLGVTLLLVDCAPLFDRPGNPYMDAEGNDWADNAERYMVFSRAVAALALDQAGLGWRPDIVHCHDWQTGMVPALLSQQPNAPGSIFTIHNLAYTGTFSHQQFIQLGLPNEWWSMERLEFYGNFSMLKAGIVFADRVTTVSPTYAQEIQTPEQGHGLDGLLRHCSHKLSGILNGIDQQTWDPASDPHLVMRYTLGRNHLRGKQANKAALLAALGLDSHNGGLARPLLGFVGRLVEQKGIDLLLEIIPELIRSTGACFVFLGTGKAIYERQLKRLASRYPDRLAAQIGYSESLAHQIEAAADIFLMPSRFEPCGLNQLYSLRYGTPPVAHRTGGLADTLVDADTTNIEQQTATGILFEQPTAEALRDAIGRALSLLEKPRLWRQIIRRGMQQQFGWEKSAIHYLALYRDVIKPH